MRSHRETEVHEYDADFYRFLASFASRSAEYIVPLLTAVLPINSVADFGCGQGAWLSVWRKAGAAVTGVDGTHVDQQHLMIDAHQFRAADLTRPIDLGRRYDLVQSLEVAEHLPSDCAPAFIDTLTHHGQLVMFSAAVRGQGGEHHLNEQPLEYWRAKFSERGYLAVDCIRPQIAGNPRIQDWYRHNIIVYAQEGYFEALPEPLRACAVPDNEKLRNYWPLHDRIRHALIRQLPRGAVDHLSRIKTRFAARRLRP